MKELMSRIDVKPDRDEIRREVDALYEIKSDS